MTKITNINTHKDYKPSRYLATQEAVRKMNEITERLKKRFGK